MNLSALILYLQSSTIYQTLLKRLREKPASHETSGLALNVLGAARPCLIAALQQDLQQPLLLLTAKPEDALQSFRQLSAWSLSPNDVLHFPESESLPIERTAISLSTRQRRLAVLDRLSRPESVARCPIAIASARALMQQTVAPERFRRATTALAPDETHPLMELLASWQQIGYEPVAIVEQPGQYSHRGGIVDIWPPTSDVPVRIDFFGDEIDSIRRFDLVTQRSREPLRSLEIVPASEALPRYGPDAARELQLMETALAKLNDASRREFEEDIAGLSESKRIRHLDFYLAYLEPQQWSLFDYLPRDTIVIADDWIRVLEAARGWSVEVEQMRAEAIARGEIPRRFRLPVFDVLNPSEGAYRKPDLDLTFGLGEESDMPWAEQFVSAPRYGSRILDAVDDWRERLAANQRVVVVSRQAERVAELLGERGLAVPLTDEVGDAPLSLIRGVLLEGFEHTLPPNLIATPASAGGSSGYGRFLLITDAELFGYTRLDARRTADRRAAPVESFYADLEIGDYVVHVEHGIARYAGLVRRDFHGVEREYLQLEYAGGDKLFVPVDQADRVARYVGSGEQSPVLHRLGTTDWETAKAKARKAVADIAEDLMILYAKRAQVRGYAFGPDTGWQRELEDSFAYVETPDQLRALASIKRDMESEQPMDRLVCGDVGYGKTEVALRAAFKAVMDGKQVGILVPTTVLAEQHLKTFRERLEAFPVEVEMISRFRTESQQKKILEKLAQGGVDILIGTHRLLQDDVQFKDLGLLIIDEEQRFGVQAKEKLKKLRTEVDVLTLTATPIPRTLNMALVGARDMSTIDTPPEERLPIRTIVTHYDEALIKQAILRELARGGQVFFVHNRVQGIEQVVGRLKRLVPEARIVYGHGQMKERELEKVMLDFGERKYDVLVCTAIIESGIDLPNVNTIIINRADQFGLADLYQLRGRVGRSARQSYAYLMYSRDKVLLDLARKRLQAIFESSELGAGFKIAMRDLEIRGAGDILGAKQHGHIAAIGFDLYTKLLAQAIREKKSVTPKSTTPQETKEAPPPAPIAEAVAVDLPLEAHLPVEYIPHDDLRLRLYRRMAEMTDPATVDEFAQELADRFGPVPEPALNLVYLLRVKVLAALGGVESVIADEQNVTVRVRDRLTLIEWKPSPAVEAVVTIGRIAITLPLDAEAVWQALLEKMLWELSKVRR